MPAFFVTQHHAAGLQTIANLVRLSEIATLSRLITVVDLSVDLLGVGRAWRAHAPLHGRAARATSGRRSSSALPTAATAAAPPPAPAAISTIVCMMPLGHVDLRSSVRLPLVGTPAVILAIDSHQQVFHASPGHYVTFMRGA